MQGVYVWDNKGNKYLDALAGLWCASLGKLKNAFELLGFVKQLNFFCISYSICQESLLLFYSPHLIGLCKMLS